MDSKLRQAVLELLQRFTPPIEVTLFCLAFERGHRVEFPYRESGLKSPEELLMLLCGDCIDIIRNEDEAKSPSDLDAKLYIVPKGMNQEIFRGGRNFLPRRLEEPNVHVAFQSSPIKRQALLSRYRSFISQYLANHPNGLEIEVLAEGYRQLTGSVLNYELCGFKSLQSLLKNSSDICELDDSLSRVYPKVERKRAQTTLWKTTKTTKNEVAESESVRQFELSNTPVITVCHRNSLFIPTGCIAKLAGLRSDDIVEYLNKSCVDIRNTVVLRDDEPEEAKLRAAIAATDCPFLADRDGRLKKEIFLIPIEAVAPLVAAFRGRDEKFVMEIEAINSQSAITTHTI